MLKLIYILKIKSLYKRVRFNLKNKRFKDLIFIRLDRCYEFNNKF